MASRRLVTSPPKVPRPPNGARVRTATSPDPPGSSRWAVKGRQTLISRVYLLVSLTGPAPSGSAGTSRRCQGCSHPHRRLPAQAALSFTPPLRRQGVEGLSPPLDSKRLVAHVVLGPVISNQQQQRPRPPCSRTTCGSLRESYRNLMIKCSHPKCSGHDIPSAVWSPDHQAGARSAARTQRPGPRSAHPPAATGTESDSRQPGKSH